MLASAVGWMVGEGEHDGAYGERKSSLIRIETERLLLRTPGEADLAAYLGYRNEAAALAAQHMELTGEDDARAFLRTQAALPEEAAGWRMLAIEEKDRPGPGTGPGTGPGIGPGTGPVIGAGAGIVGEVGVFLHAGQPEEGNIGWWLHPDARERGIAVEAARALLGWCFASRNLHRVTAGCLASNAASFRVMERLGMRVETRTRESRKGGHAWHDEIGCALLRREWLAATTATTTAGAATGARSAVPAAPGPDGARGERDVPPGRC